MSCPGMEVLTPTGVRVPRRAALQLETGDIQDRQICRISLIILHWIERWGGLGMVRLKDFRLWSSIENQNQEDTSESLTASSLPQKRFCCIIPQQCWLWGQPKGLAAHWHVCLPGWLQKVLPPTFVSDLVKVVRSRWPALAVGRLLRRSASVGQYTLNLWYEIHFTVFSFIWCFPLLGVPCSRPHFQFFPTPVHITKH